MGYSVLNNRIKMTRGDTATFKISIDYLNTGEPYEPDDSDIIRFTVKKYLSDRNSLISKDISTDTMLLTINTEETSQLPFGRYYYDIQLIKADGKVDTFLSDILELSKEIG